MADSIPKEYVDLLKNFVTLCKASPSRLHDPELKFFKDYLTSLGAQIPEGDGKTTDDQQLPKEEPMHHSSSEEPINAGDANTTESDDGNGTESDSEESDIELDNTGVIEPDAGEPLPQGDESVAVSDEMLEESNNKRMEAVDALNEGNFDEALKLFTEAIMNNPQGAAGYAKRAGGLLKMGRPNAAIVDCNKALSLNPDLALAYKNRGRANRLLGKWEAAAKDLGLACKLDYSEDANEWLKEIMPNVRKLQDHRRKYERKQQEREMKARQNRYKRAASAHERAQKAEAPTGPGDFSGFGGFMPPDMQALLEDPEVFEAFQDPEVAAAFQDMNKNPGNIGKHYSNPKVAKIMAKIIEKFGDKGKAS